MDVEFIEVFKETSRNFRKAILELSSKVWALKQSAQTVPPTDGEAGKNQQGEMIANAMLAYRHLEDARMRLGKCIQAADGGVSVYE